jgi:hypothetical protein
MAPQTVQGIPALAADDGAAFIFGISNSPLRFGFMHRPFNTLETSGGTVKPPVEWTVCHNLESWVETIKHGFRNGTSVTVAYDDAINVEYTSWSATYTSGSPFAITYAFQQVYGVTDA